MVLLVMTGGTSAEPFSEITVGIPVSSISEAETWYVNFLGPNTEMLKPAPGIIEFKATPEAWLQIHGAEGQQTSGAIIRFLVDDMSATQTARAALGIETGEAIEIPNVVTYSEFSDPFGNALGLYALP